MRIMQKGNTLFKESIFYLREDLYKKKYFPFSHSPNGNTQSCISTSFKLSKPWNIGGIFTIRPTEEIRLTQKYTGLISIIDNPDWITKRPPPHRFGILIVSLLAFITKRPVKNSVKEDYDLRVINDENKVELALAYPLSIHPYLFRYEFQEGEEQICIQELEELIKKIIALPEDTYEFIIQVIRVIELSINIKDEEFGLAYSLLIQAIESVAQEKFPQKKKDNKKYYINKKFKDFIEEYCPVTEWDNLLHLNNVFQLPEPLKPILPSALTPYEYDLSIRLTYKLRCNFVHKGQQPPHCSPDLILNPYFEHTKFSFTFEHGEGEGKEQITEDTNLITYELMLGIAKHSIMKWIKAL